MLHGGGAPKRKSLSWAHTDTGGTDSCMVPGSLDLAKLCGLGHLTVLSAQAGRNNGIFNRLPVSSDRKLLMPHLQLVSGGKCANSPSEHLICALLAHSARSLRGWQFSSGNGSTCISHCQGPLKAPCALLFSRAPFFCPGLGTKGTAALELGLRQVWPAFLVWFPSWLSPRLPHVRSLQTAHGSLSLLFLSNLKPGTSVLSPQDLRCSPSWESLTPHHTA